LSLIARILVVIFAVLYGWKYLVFLGVDDPPSYSIDIKYFGPLILLSTDIKDLSIEIF
jgi:hypothetical protein